MLKSIKVPIVLKTTDVKNQPIMLIFHIFVLFNWYCQPIMSAVNRITRQAKHFLSHVLTMCRRAMWLSLEKP